jgi:hypothetical protein
VQVIQSGLGFKSYLRIRLVKKEHVFPQGKHVAERKSELPLV